MKKYTKKFTVLASEYMNCSINGNPKKRLVLQDTENNVYIATTGTDCLCGYMTYRNGETYLFTYHYTRTSSNMVIDFAEE
jgi:hypothetical protein